MRKIVDIIDFVKKVFNKVGLEVIAIIGVIMAVQYITGIDLNLDLVIYILVLVAFADALIKMALSMYETIRLKLVAIDKKCKEYTVEQLDKEVNTNIQEKGLELVKEVKDDLKEIKVSRSEKKALKESEKIEKKKLEALQRAKEAYEAYKELSKDSEELEDNEEE